jgi:hypothetical protein
MFHVFRERLGFGAADMRRRTEKPRFGCQKIDQVTGTFGPAKRREIIATVEIPFQPRSMTHSQNEVGIGPDRFQEGTKGGGVSPQAYPEIDMGRDDPGQGAS